jgi:hypothetical protein
VARFDRTIPPGGEGKITLEIRTTGYDGNVNKSARVTTNDPKNAQVTVSMKGEVWTPIQLKPSYAQLKGTVGDEIQQVLVIQAKKEEPLNVKLESISIPEQVSAELEETEKGRSYKLTVKNKVKGEATYGGQIKLTTNYPEKPEIVIRVSGNVRPIVEARPKVLSFGRLSLERAEQSKANNRFSKRTVTVALNKGDDLKVDKVELEKSLFTAEIKEVGKGRTVQVLVEPILEKLQKGPNTDSLKIHTNQKDAEVLEVPIRIDIF